MADKGYTVACPACGHTYKTLSPEVYCIGLARGNVRHKLTKMVLPKAKGDK